jgi:hypothetical protein
MPFAGFQDFEACVAKQKSIGHTNEQAQRICGFLKHKFENAVTPDQFKPDYSQNPTLQDLHEILLKLATEKGQFDQQISWYKDSGGKERCGNCVFFSGYQCEIVEGPITEGKICRFWIGK